jgi:hypothetical protein
MLVSTIVFVAACLSLEMLRLFAAADGPGMQKHVHNYRVSPSLIAAQTEDASSAANIMRYAELHRQACTRRISRQAHVYSRGFPTASWNSRPSAETLSSSTLRPIVSFGGSMTS